uniref:Transferrin-like domain-containing protein n=1 Tax=Panagrellus redivivus TaxID=6233 RepID=A0A7E4VUC1_PANRE
EETYKGHCVKLSQRGLIKLGCQAEGFLDPKNTDCAAAADEIFG